MFMETIIDMKVCKINFFFLFDNIWDNICRVLMERTFTSDITDDMVGDTIWCEKTKCEGFENHWIE